MTASATLRNTGTAEDPWSGFRPGPWQHSIDVRSFILSNFTPYTGDAAFLAGPDGEDAARLGDPAAGLPQRRARPARLRRRDPHPRRRGRLPRGLHLRRRRRHRRAADRHAAEAPHDARRRLADGGDGHPRGRAGARPAGQGDLHPVPQDPQRGRLRHLHPPDPHGAQRAPHHRPAGRLRSRADHRRLPPGGPVRRGPPHRAEEGRPRRSGRPAVLRELGPLPRGARRADQGAPEAEEPGRQLRLRPPAPRRDLRRSRAVDLPRLPRLGEEPGRRRDEHRPALRLLRRLRRARPRRRPPHRGGRAGGHRRAGHQAAHRPVPAHHRLRPDLLRRPLLGHLVRRRLRRRRPHPGDEDVVPAAADAAQPRPGARAEHHRLLGRGAAGRATRTSAR